MEAVRDRCRLHCVLLVNVCLSVLGSPTPSSFSSCPLDLLQAYTSIRNSVVFFTCSHNCLRTNPYNKSLFSILVMVQLLSSNLDTSILLFYLTNNIKMSYCILNGVAQLVRALSCVPKGQGFNSQSGNMLRFRVRSPLWGYAGGN